MNSGSDDAASPPPPKRGRGRPRKNAEAPPKTTAEAPTRSLRPRPPKNDKPAEPLPQEAEVPPSPTPEALPIKRKRGRPRKEDRQTEAPDAPPNDDELAPPPQEAQEVAPIKRKPGRPRKTDRPVEAPDAAPEPPAPRPQRGGDPMALTEFPPEGHISGQLFAAIKEHILPRLPLMKKNLAMVYNTQFPSWTFDTVKEGLPLLPISERWTERDAEKARKTWRERPGANKLLDLGGNKQLLTLFKGSLKIMRCPPEDIISRDYGLSYDESQNKSSSTHGWSGYFCQYLHDILAHPLWMHSPKLLATAIQYVVAVDTADDRPFGAIPSLLTGDSFIRRVQRKSMATPGVSYSATHRKMRQEYGRGVGNLSDLFTNVETLVAKRKKPGPQAHPKKYRVTVAHLRVLLEALDMPGITGISQFYPALYYSRLIHGRRAAKEYPVVADFKELRGYLLWREHEQRLFRKTHGVTHSIQIEQESPRPWWERDFPKGVISFHSPMPGLDERVSAPQYEAGGSVAERSPTQTPNQNECPAPESLRNDEAVPGADTVLGNAIPTTPEGVVNWRRFSHRANQWTDMAGSSEDDSSEVESLVSLFSSSD